MKKFIVEHKIFSLVVVIFILYIIISSVVWIIVNNKQTNNVVVDEEIISTTEPEPETGGSGAATSQKLLLSGWDTSDNTDIPLAEVMSIQDQNLVIKSILADYSANYKDTSLMIDGSIKNVEYDWASSDRSFSVELEKATYLVHISQAGFVLNIEDLNGNRSVPINS